MAKKRRKNPYSIKGKTPAQIRAMGSKPNRNTVIGKTRSQVAKMGKIPPRKKTNRGTRSGVSGVLGSIGRGASAAGHAITHAPGSPLHRKKQAPKPQRYKRVVSDAGANRGGRPRAAKKYVKPYKAPKGGGKARPTGRARVTQSGGSEGTVVSRTTTKPQRNKPVGRTKPQRNKPQRQPKQRAVKQRQQQQGVAPNNPAAGADEQQQGGTGYDIPEMPDFTQMVQPLPSYDDLAGGQPSLSDIFNMVGVGGSGGSQPLVSTPGTPGTTAVTPGAPGGAQPVTNDVQQVAGNLTAAMGGTANQGTPDISAYADAVAAGMATQVPTQGTAGGITTTGGSSGGSSGGGSGGRAINPYTAAAQVQKMIQAEQMFGPKLMAQYLKNQGYSINNMKDYQSAWIDSAMFGPNYSYATGRAEGQQIRNQGYALSNQGKALSMQIVSALAGPKIQSQLLTNQGKRVGIAGKKVQIKSGIATTNARLRAYAQSAEGKKLDNYLKTLNITSKNLRNQILGKQLQNTTKAGGMTASQRNSLLKKANDQAHLYYYGKVKTSSVPGRAPVVEEASVDYPTALRRLIAQGVPATDAIKVLNGYYRRGEDGRPKSKFWGVQGGRIVTKPKKRNRRR